MGIGVIYTIIHIVVMEHFKSSQFVLYEIWLFSKLLIEVFIARLLLFLNAKSENRAFFWKY